MGTIIKFHLPYLSWIISLGWVLRNRIRRSELFILGIIIHCEVSKVLHPFTSNICEWNRINILAQFLGTSGLLPIFRGGHLRQPSKSIEVKNYLVDLPFHLERLMGGVSHPLRPPS